MTRTYGRSPCLITASIEPGLSHLIGRIGFVTMYLEDDDNGGYYPVDFVDTGGESSLMLRAFDEVDIKLLSSMTREEREAYAMVYPELLKYLAE